jgi:dTDP-glucose pyrophosphorylase
MNESLELTKVPASGTLRDVLVALDQGGLGVALIVESDGRLVGLLTDGDARRALLAGNTLAFAVEPLMQRVFVSVGVAAGRAEVLDLMQARRIDVVPIVDARGHLRGCHQLHDVLGGAARDAWAVIMAGGRGSRLGPLTQDVPKPMIRVAGRPILERLVLHLVGFGIRRIFLSINYLGHVIEEHFGDGSAFGCTITYLREERQLGTAGALGLLPEAPAHPLLLVNGDLVTQADVGALLDAHASEENTALTLAIRRYLHAVPFGCVEVDNGRIVGIEEKPTMTRLINAGMYVVEPRLLGRVPRDVEFGMPALVSDCLSRGERVQSFEVLDDWIDVGQKEQLKQARGEVK